MKITTCNLMRPNSKTIERNQIFQETINQINPDIIIATETNSILDFGMEYITVSTLPLCSNHQNIKYETGENRVTIYSKYPFIKQFPTTDQYSSVCAQLETTKGPLLIYGTIIGYLGGKKDPFKKDLQEQTNDIKHLAKEGDICFSGDLNISFAGYPYPSKLIRERVNNTFDQLQLTNLIAENEDSVLHTVISKSFLKGKQIKNISVIKFDKRITDHNFITVTIA